MSSTMLPSPRQARLILIGTALLLTLGMGIRQSFGLFLGPITHDLGVTAADFTLALAIQNIVWGLSQALVGAISDRFGLRITMMAGAAIYIVGLIILAAAQGALALIVSGGLIGVALSCTATSLAMTACVRAVSPERRTKMLGVVSAVGSLGTLVVPIATQGLLAREPWQTGRSSSYCWGSQCYPRHFGRAAPTGYRATEGRRHQCARCSARPCVTGHFW